MMCNGVKRSCEINKVKITDHRLRFLHRQTKMLSKCARYRSVALCRPIHTVVLTDA